MKDFIKSMVHYLKPRVDYGDVRVVDIEDESIVVRNGVVEAVKKYRSVGFGVRVLIGNGWGFSSSSVFTPAEARKKMNDAIAIARASGMEAGGVALARTDPYRAKYKTDYRVDPFKIRVDDKINFLFEVDKILRESPKVKIAVTSLFFIKEIKHFASTEGSLIRQDLLHSSGGMRIMAPSEGELQVRSYHNAGQAGYEYIKRLNLKKNAARIREELLMLIAAKQCPAGEKTLILDQDQLALQIHESIGHATELDRILGTEASYAGTSFLRPMDLGRLRYGSKIVNVVADARLKGGLGSFGYDDEGVKAKREKLIENGILVGFQSSRETASVIKKRPSGGMRSDGWNRIPLIRMTNINLLPGSIPFEEIIRETKDGIYMSTNRSWSIDDRRLNFQFGCEIAFRVR
ncbi:MAG TPA: TldD/PmbA family protein, partial [bacterium (Candidatus Stahlbacteria)]|nr:TldD/PmbA family protein [Candidatus Stahlbacteria bacterium]